MLDDLGDDIRREYQEMFDRLGRTYKGRPKDQIRAVLRRELEEDPDREWVDAIHDGTRIEVEFGWA